MAPSPDGKIPQDEDQPNPNVIDYASARERKQGPAPRPQLNIGAAWIQFALIVLLGLAFLVWYMIYL